MIEKIIGKHLDWKLKDTILYIQKIGNHFLSKNYGAIAQLGERLNGIQEVSGSIPLSSTGLRFEKSDRKKMSRRSLAETG